MPDPYSLPGMSVPGKSVFIIAVALPFMAGLTVLCGADTAPPPEAAVENAIGQAHDMLPDHPQQSAQQVARDLRLSGREPTAVINAGSFKSAVRVSPRVNPYTFLPLLSENRDLKNRHSEIQIGNFVVDFTTLEAAYLWSDNISQRADAGSDAIAYSALRARVGWKVSEKLAFHTDGAFIWLPLEGQAGIDGFGVTSPFSAVLPLDPVARAQVSYTDRINDWDVELIEDFRVEYDENYTIGTVRYVSLIDDQNFDHVDRAGRYQFNNRTRNDFISRDRLKRNDPDLRYVNLAAATVGHDFPSATRVELSVYHRNYRNINEDDDDPAAETENTGLTLLAESKHENARFRPFAFYKIEKSNVFNKRQEGRIGVTSKLTDYTRMVADAGYYRLDPNKLTTNGEVRTGEVYRIAAYHDINSRTSHGAGIDRQIVDNSGVNHIIDTYFYEIRKSINSRLKLSALLEKGEVEDLDAVSVDTDYFQARARLDVTNSPRHVFSITSYYRSHDTVNEIRAGDYDVYGVQLDSSYAISDSLRLQLLLRHERNKESLANLSYRENLALVRLIKDLN